MALRERFRDAAVDLMAPPLILLPPFVNFLKFNGYGLLRPESLVVATWLGAGGLALGLILAFGGRTVRGLVVGLLAVLIMDLQLDWFGLEARTHIAGIAKLVLAAFVIGAALGWAVGRNIGRILAASFATVLIATLVWPASETREGPEEPAPGIGARAHLPPILHLVLDEQTAPEAIPLEFPGGAALRDDLARRYLAWGFRLFGRGYSRYSGTHNSLPNLLNFTTSPIDAVHVDRNPFAGVAAGPVAVEANAYFRRMSDRGYAIHVYQSDFMDFCSTPGVAVATCFTYSLRGIGILEGLALPAPEKARLIGSKLLQLSEFGDFVRANYRVARYLLAKAGLAGLPPWTLDTLQLPPSGSFSALERLGADLAAGPRGGLYFAHLLLPHFPYAYDADCGLRQSVADWRLRYDRAALAPFINTAETRARAYALYFAQMACLHERLAQLFEGLRAAGAYDDAIVIVHGDHGSRIGRLDPHAKWAGLLSEADYVDHFATLFALKAPGVEPGYDTELWPIQELFAAIVGNDWALPAPAPDLEHYVFLRKAAYGPAERRPMPPFGAP